MDKLFLTILNMSLTGAFVIAGICLARLPLKRAPKVISYCLWTVAGLRLLLPFSIESVFALIPFKARPIPQDIALQAVPRIDSGMPYLNDAVSSVLPAASPMASANPLQLWITLGAAVWLVGVCAMAGYGILSYVLLKRKMLFSRHVEDNIYEAENIKSPFVLGFLSPRIYLPHGLSARERGYIILHERTHIRRHDHLVKLAAYLVLCLHWFNPFAWVAFVLMGVDMEMSCDERVMREMGSEIKKEYSLSLLSLATERRIIAGSPLAFGEGGIKQRIKNVLNFKRKSRVIIIAAVALVMALSIGFMANRSGGYPLSEMQITYAENPTQTFPVMQLNWDGEVYEDVTAFWQEPVKRGTELGYAQEIVSAMEINWSIYELKGQSRDYLIIYENGSEDVWRIMSTQTPEVFAAYILRDATEQERFEKLLSLTLYSDGRARLVLPPISSFALATPCYYTFTDSELLIHYESGELVVRFELEGDNRLVFAEATVPLHASAGAVYMLAEQVNSAPIGIVAEGISVPQVVLSFVRSYVSGQFESNLDGKVAVGLLDNWLINSIEIDEQYDEYGLVVYCFDWQVHTTDAATTSFADIDDEGWFNTSPKPWYVVFEEYEGVYRPVYSPTQSSPSLNEMLTIIEKMRYMQVENYLVQMFTDAYAPHYLGLRFEMNDYSETVEGDNYTATLMWTMFHKGNGIDGLSDAGKETEANFLLQMTAKLTPAGRIDFKTADVFLDSSATGAPRYDTPIADVFPGRWSSYPSVGLYNGAAGMDAVVANTAKRIIADETGWHPAGDEIIVVVGNASGMDITLYFAEAGTDASIAKELESGVPDETRAAHTIEVDMEELFPKGFLGHVWAVAQTTGEFHERLLAEGARTEFASAVLNVVYDPADAHRNTQSKSYIALEALPQRYTEEQAVIDGVYVVTQGAEVYNQAHVDAFYASIEVGASAFMRTALYSEATVVITDFYYDGKLFTVITDNTRAGGERTISTFTHLVKTNRTHPIHGMVLYVLSNSETATDRGTVQLPSSPIAP